MLSVLVTIYRSAMMHPRLGVAETSLLLVGCVLPNCKLPAVHPIPISLSLQTEIVPPCLQRLRICFITVGNLPVGHLSGLAPISLVLTIVLTR